MTFLRALWIKLTQTKALENSSGELETLFFESVYRIAYILGFSMLDSGLYTLYSVMVKSSICMLLASELMYIIMEPVGFDDLASSLNVSLLHMITFYRYRNMICHRDLYRSLSVAMESETFDISTENRKKIVQFWSTVNENYLKRALGIGNLTLVAWFIYPLVDDVEFNLIVYLKLPFDYISPRNYAITYVGILVVFYYISHFVMITDLRLQAYLLHLICQYNVLADCFENIVEDCKHKNEDADKKVIKTDSPLHWDNNFQEKYKKRLNDLVEQHKLLLRLTLDLRASLSGPMLGQLAASCVIICFIGYQAATTITENITKCLMSLFFLGYNLFGFYIICRWCEEIKTQSESIGTAVYCSKWESGVAVIPTVRSSLVLVIARANKPVVMTAGGMYNLSLMSYSSLLKTSYSALTVLLRFRK